MKSRIMLVITTQLILSLLLTTTFAWVHPDGSDNTKFEMYGPRAEKLLIHLFDNESREFEGLKNGDIDIIDWPLTKPVYDELRQPPYNETIQVVNYGPEFGLYILDMNSNNNQYLGNPPDPAYPNPVADHNDSIGNWRIKNGDGAANNHNPMSSVYMRRAIAYLIDRPGLIADPAIGTGFGYPMYTTIPPALTKYLLDVYGDPTMPWAWKYDPVAANATLEEGGFKINPATGYRYWDLNDDGVEDPDEWVQLLFYIRVEDPGRYMIGTVLLEEMASINLRVSPLFNTYSSHYLDVMFEKNFHMYIGGWMLSSALDHLILWSWDYYWHPGFCYNYGGHNDPAFNQAADGLVYASTEAEAVSWAMIAQHRQAYNVLSIPIYCPSGNKAFYRTNTGSNPEDSTEGEAWEGIINMASLGIDNTWTFMNMHTEQTSCGNGMVIDWGFRIPEVKQLNPIFASWLHDWNVLDKVYESLLMQNASDLGELKPWIAKDFHMDTYTHPMYGDCTKITFTLRNDVMWSDGTPLTVADVHFTFVELWQILRDRGIPEPWWHSRIESLLAFSIIDPSNFELLLDTKSYWEVGWIGGNIILPKHIWKPIAEEGDPVAFMPDPGLVGTGPWKFVEYVPRSYLLLERNEKFHRGSPAAVDVMACSDGLVRFDLGEGEDITVELKNLCVRGRLDNLDVSVTVTYPNGTSRLHQYINLTIDSGETLGVALPMTWKYGMYGINISFHAHAFADCQWYTYSCSWWRAYVTIKEDIAGSTYYDDIGLTSHPYKHQLQTPDFKVNMKDLGRAARAFGTYISIWEPRPDPRWDPAADINKDGKVDMRDIAAIARQFGWEAVDA